MHSLGFDASKVVLHYVHLHCDNIVSKVLCLDVIAVIIYCLH